MPPGRRRSELTGERAADDVTIIDMRWSGNGPGQRRGYHHGNLGEALIEAALDLIARHGAAGMMSLHIWALSHGIASLFARGDGGRRRLPMSPEELLEAGVLVYLRGLGIIEADESGSPN